MGDVMKIMIIEDDIVIRNMLGEGIEKWGFRISKVENFSEIVNIYISEKPHLILLDINLPTYDGFYWCNKIREVSKVPIIFISSRNTPMDMIMSMNMGGDDFIQKPLDIDVLMAKVNSLLRRSYTYSEIQSNVFEHNGIILNINNWEVSYESAKFHLSKTEFLIFHLLLQNKGKIVSRYKIKRKLWKDENFIDDNTLTVNINRLRKKLNNIGKENFIKTIKKEGYIIQ